MPTKEVIDVVENILTTLDSSYPHYEIIDAGMSFDDPTTEQNALYEEAIQILLNEGLVKQGKDEILFQITPTGRDIIRDGNYRSLLNRREEKEQHSYNVQFLEFQKLQGEVEKLQRDSKFWKWVAISGAVAFIIEVAKFAIELFKDK